MSGFWKIIVILFLIGFLLAGTVYYYYKPNYPVVVNIYKWRYSQMLELDAKKSLIVYTNTVMNDSIDGLSYSGLLAWEHRWLEYTDGYLKQPRPELPIPILERGKGRCGEFALLYIGLLLANGIDCRLVIDCSVKTDNRTAGDHVWVEVYVWEYKEDLRQIVGRWIHVDPTENKIDQPNLYAVKCSDICFNIHSSLHSWIIGWNIIL